MNSQAQEILNHLQNVGSLTPLDALNKFGCMRLGARIYDLRTAGHDIRMTLETHTDAHGQTKRFARYWMVGE